MEIETLFSGLGGLGATALPIIAVFFLSLFLIMVLQWLGLFSRKGKARGLATIYKEKVDAVCDYLGDNHSEEGGHWSTADELQERVKRLTHLVSSGHYSQAVRSGTLFHAEIDGQAQGLVDRAISELQDNLKAYDSQACEIEEKYHMPHELLTSLQSSLNEVWKGARDAAGTADITHPETVRNALETAGAAMEEGNRIWNRYLKEAEMMRRTYGGQSAAQ